MGKHLKRLTVEEARVFLEGIRWPNGPVCIHCYSLDVVSVKGGRAGLKRCKTCRKQFTVTVGTIFERSHIPLNDWVYAFDAMCASKKGVSALQLSRELGCQYKTAWFMCHRIRLAMKSDLGILGGPGKHVEADEAYIGGKPRKHGNQQTKRNQWTGPKTPIFCLVERGGKVKVRVIANVTGKGLRKEIIQSVNFASTFNTDESMLYQSMDKLFGTHLTVKHSAAEYFRHSDQAGINTAESFFALMKRGVYGNFHNVSRKHLPRYCDEFAFRWNTRKFSDGDRVVEALSQTTGKRLTYRAAGQVKGPTI